MNTYRGIEYCSCYSDVNVNSLLASLAASSVSLAVKSVGRASAWARGRASERIASPSVSNHNNKPFLTLNNYL